MPRVLLTEDEKDQRNLYHEVLTDAGYDVVDACNGAEAIEMCQRCKPDIVVLDIQMPGVDGIDALSKILPKNKALPVIFHSAYPNYKGNFMTWAADAFVVKTGDSSELVAAIHKLSSERGIEIPVAGAKKPLAPTKESCTQDRGKGEVNYDFV